MNSLMEIISILVEKVSFFFSSGFGFSVIYHSFANMLEGVNYTRVSPLLDNHRIFEVFTAFYILSPILPHNSVGVHLHRVLPPLDRPTPLASAHHLDVAQLRAPPDGGRRLLILLFHPESQLRRSGACGGHAGG